MFGQSLTKHDSCEIAQVCPGHIVSACNALHHLILFISELSCIPSIRPATLYAQKLACCCMIESQRFVCNKFSVVTTAFQRPMVRAASFKHVWLWCERVLHDLEVPNQSKTAPRTFEKHEARQNGQRMMCKQSARSQGSDPLNLYQPVQTLSHICLRHDHIFYSLLPHHSFEAWTRTSDYILDQDERMPNVEHLILRQCAIQSASQRPQKTPESRR